MQLNPYLHFDGNCEAAFKFYAQCFGGKIDAMVPWAGSAAEKQAAPEWRDKVLHASLTVNGEVLMGSDVPPDRYQKPAGFSVTVQFQDPAEADRIFNALADQATVTMPIQKTFWAARAGMLTDRFGIPWLIHGGMAG